MKRSPSYCSSSSSCIENNTLDYQHQIPKTTRTRAKKNPQADTSSKRSSIFRGVTRHRWTGRYEAHLWDKSTWNSNQSKKGRQIYLGAYDNEEAAARTYDLAALKYWGPKTILNFRIETYMDELEKMKNVSKEEFLASLRRMSSGFSRGVSKYRGVARHHHNGRWEARIGRVFGNKYLYLGTYSTQEEAAAAYDMAAIEYRGPNAVTNFDISTYADRLKNTLPNTEPLIENQNLESSIETQADEQECNEQQQQQKQQQELENSTVLKYETINFSPSIDTHAMLVMDEHNNEDPWNLCLDTDFDPLLVPDTPLENHGDLPDLFDDIGFEDNIDYIFDTPIFENELIYQDGHSNNMLGKEGKGHEGNLITSPSSSSSWSSSSSTTNSVSWNV